MSSEDIVRALPKEPPKTLTAPADGQKLEDIIGDLQSHWGVPQYPQEYRITLKVAEERDRADVARTASLDDVQKQRAAASQAPATPAGVRREKAPAAPRVGPSDDADIAETPRRRRGRRRGRRGRGSSPAA